MKKPRAVGPVITFDATLAEGRSCLSFDRDGEARLVLVLSQSQAVTVAKELPRLMDTAFAVALQPFGESGK